MERTQTDNH